jgi:hypothetical protein
MQNTEKGTAKESGSVMGSTLASLSASAVATIPKSAFQCSNRPITVNGIWEYYYRQRLSKKYQRKKSGVL